MRTEKSRGMRSTPDIMQDVIRAGQDYYALLLFALLLTTLTLTGLARLSGLRSLVGLKTMLATSTA
jgi:hypothetical protein